MLTIGTRGSQLALWQANWVAARLRESGVDSRIEVIKTTGDKITDVALSEVGGKGLFTKELEDALLERRIDIAVHSMKDMPTGLPAGLRLAAVPPREDPRDAVVGKKLSELRAVAVVGTSSLRRAAQLRAMRPDLTVGSIRGNLDTRLRKLDDGDYDAIVLAAAGLRRLGWQERIAELLDPGEMCPAVGQGALAIEARDEEGAVTAACMRLADEATWQEVTAERALLGALGGGCQVPIGAHGVVSDGELHLQAVVCAPDGRRTIRREARGRAEHAARVGVELAGQLLAAGASDILESVYGAA